MTMDLMKIGEEANLDVQRQNINLPANYSPQNALAAAYLVLKQIKDKNKKPVLDVCTEESIKECLFSMIVQGLNPIKHQCGFIPYGTKLTLSREYMGSITVAKRVDSSIKDIRAQVIYKGDKIIMDVINGRRHIKTEQTFETMMNNEIIGAYAVAVDHEENQIYTDLMTIDQIKQSWKQSQLHPVTESGEVRADSTHAKFEEEMVKKTIYNRLCKTIINTSDDETLLREVEATEESLDASDIIEIEVQKNANKKLIDFNKAKESGGQDKDIINVTPNNSVEVGKPENATMDQARMITGLSVELKQKEKMMHVISGYVGRNVKKLSELTFDEANEYIDVLNQQIKDIPKNDEDSAPDWANA